MGWEIAMNELRRMWWGKYHAMNGVNRMIWIGPMTRQEMREHFPDFRHTCTSNPLAGIGEEGLPKTGNYENRG